METEKDQPSHVKNPFVCNICKKSYTRLDHLGRHYRSHTSEKPFTCDQCAKRFSRVDLLRRHRANHSDAGSAATRSKVRGPRATKACSACVTAKLKCAETRPCPRCVARHIACHDGAFFNTTDNVAARDCTGRAAAPSFDPTPLQSEVDMHDMVATSLQPASHLNAPYQGAGPPGDELPVLSPDDVFTFDDALMGEFLRDIVYPISNPFHQVCVNQTAPLPDELDLGFDELLDIPPSFFDRGQPTNIAITDDANNVSRARGGAVTPRQRKGIDIGQQAFIESFWLWTPASGDNRSAEQKFLTIPDGLMVSESRHMQTAASLDVSLASRDRLLSMILRTCEPSLQRHVLSRFPSCELITSVLTSFVALHFDHVGQWIHVPSLRISHEHEAFLASILSAAAVQSQHPEIRRLGYAVQEAARYGVADRFEEDNRKTRDLRTVQAYALHLHAGIWSGLRRKMEISESFTYPLITMMRRSGRFRQAPQISSTDAEDVDSSADGRWNEWIQQESFKRLAYHVFLQDTAISMSLLTQPLLSQSDLSLGLPSSTALWEADTSEQWETHAPSASTSRVPTIRDALSNLQIIVDHQHSIDVQLSLDVVVSSLWQSVWQCRQMLSISPLDGTGSNSLTVTSLQQELELNFNYVKLRSEEWKGGISPLVALKLEICLIHLCVSLEDIQIFGGKEGEAEARKTVPRLQTWSQSRKAREAIYHAGQVLKFVSCLPKSALQGFVAVAVYHASLVIWAYGVIVEHKGKSAASQMSTQIDADDSPELQRFLITGQRSPCIADYSVASGTANTGASAAVGGTIPITNTPKTMQVISTLLSSGASDSRSALPIVTSLSGLIQSLGKAAGVMKQTPLR